MSACAENLQKTEKQPTHLPYAIPCAIISNKISPSPK